MFQQITNTIAACPDYVHTNVEFVLLNLHKLMVGLATVKTAG